MYNGIINVYKEAGFTSHDVVAKLRGILKQKKIGHTGTLDPDATGVLPVCLGNATKLCDMLTDKSKEYRAEMLLGTVTDTEDISGKVLGIKEVNVTEEEIKDIIMSFVGEYDQIPPMYSALKVNGQKLCDLAREGIVIERKPRSVNIISIEILSVNLPKVDMIIHCSKGTYIRSLCRDIGEKAGCGACMSSLIRTRVGVCTLEKAYKLSEIEALVKSDSVSDVITPTDDMFPDYPAVKVTGRNEMFARNGNILKLPYVKADMIKVYLSDGRFAGVYGYNSDTECYKPEKMFLSEN